MISDVHKELSSLRMKNSNRKYKLRTGLFIAWINRWGHILIRYIWFTNKLLRGLFVLNFVISGKVTSLPQGIKYVKRSKYSFHDFSAKHTPSATLIARDYSSGEQCGLWVFSVGFTWIILKKYICFIFRGIVYVIDSASVQKDIKEVAE